jgi:hypothetical protein
LRRGSGAFRGAPSSEGRETEGDATDGETALDRVSIAR